NAAGAIDRVDGRHVIAVTLFDRCASHQVDAERCARQRELDVMHRQGVAREHDVDVAVADQRGEMLHATGVDDDRTSDDGYPSAGRLDLTHHLRDTSDAALDPPLRRYVVAHEGKAEAVAFAELRRHAYAVVTADDAL